LVLRKSVEPEQTGELEPNTKGEGKLKTETAVVATFEEQPFKTATTE
jgi:hypothetical protein